MSYIDIKALEKLNKLKNELKGKFSEEKIIEQDKSEERKKLFEPLLSRMEPPAAIMEKKAPQLALLPSEKEETKQYLTLSKRVADHLRRVYDHKTYDHSYGIRAIDGGTGFRLGNKDVTLIGADLKIEDTVYEGTDGLWKLLTKKDPEPFLPSDLAAYKAIMLHTLAFLNQDGSVKSHRGDKYKDIIKPIYDEYKLLNPIMTMTRRKSPRASPLTVGDGFRFLPSDPAELIERMNVLIGEKQAGNANVFNELHAIRDELTRQKKIFLL